MKGANQETSRKSCGGGRETVCVDLFKLNEKGKVMTSDAMPSYGKNPKPRAPCTRHRYPHEKMSRRIRAMMSSDRSQKVFLDDF